MVFRVATKPNGVKRWWSEDEVIPTDHTNTRPATDKEAFFMRKVLADDAAGILPDIGLGDALQTLMLETA